MKIDKSPINENRSEQLNGTIPSPLGSGNRMAVETEAKSIDKIESAGGRSLLARAKEASSMVEPERMSKLSALMADGSYEPDLQTVSERLIQETEER